MPSSPKIQDHQSIEIYSKINFKKINFKKINLGKEYEYSIYIILTNVKFKKIFIF